VSSFGNGNLPPLLVRGHLPPKRQPCTIHLCRLAGTHRLAFILERLELLVRALRLETAFSLDERGL
jgi:hypothetical protein